MNIYNCISKNEWNKFAEKNTNLPKVNSNVYSIECDRSGSSGILHFSHELTLQFEMENDKLRFLIGSEIGVEDVDYSSEDWDYIKERYPGIEEEVLKTIKDYQSIHAGEKIENIYPDDVNEAKTKLGDLVRETFLKEQEFESHLSKEEKQLRYDTYYKPMVDEIMAEVLSGNKDIIKKIKDFDNGTSFQYVLLPELYDVVQEKIKTDYEQKKIPYVVLLSSESLLFPSDNKVYTLKEFNEILLNEDKNFYNQREYAYKKFGSYENYHKLLTEGNIAEKDRNIKFGYDKTNFKFFNIPNPEKIGDTFSYEALRYDIGDGNGSIFDFVRTTCSYEEFIKALDLVEKHIYYPNITESQCNDVQKIVNKESLQLKENLKPVFEKLYKAENDSKELFKHQMVSQLEANNVTFYINDALNDIKNTFESSMKNVFKKVLNDYPFASGNVSDSEFLKYTANETKKMIIMELYKPCRDSQRAINEEDLQSYNNINWDALHKVFDVFPVNANITEYVENILQKECLEKGMSISNDDKKEPEVVISSFIEKIKNKIPDTTENITIENILSAASETIKNLPTYDKFIVNGYLNGVNIQNKEDLAKFLKKEMTPKTQKKYLKKNINLGMEM